LASRQKSPRFAPGGGVLREGEMAGTAMVPAYFDILNSLKFQLILPKNRQIGKL
jgi:hypothetical protein